MRSSRLTLFAALVGGATLCSDATVSAHGSAEGTQPPTTPTVFDDGPDATIEESATPVVQLTVQGMFPVEPPFVGAGPQTVVYDDGSVLVAFRGAFAVQPLVWPYEVGQVDPADVQALLASAADAGLLAEPEPYEPTNIADAPRTTLVLDTPEGVYTHVADGLIGDEVDPRRAALQDFIGDVVALTEPVEAGAPFYTPTQIGIVAASAGSTAGPVIAWPDSSVDLADATTCTLITDPNTVEMLATGGTHAGTGFRQDGLTYLLAVRIVPPGLDC